MRFTNLEGLTIEGINGSGGGVTVNLALSGVIPADGIFVLADDGGGGVSSVVGADQILNFDFQNGPDSILLRDGDTVLDALGYGVFDGGEVFAGEASPAPDPPAGSSLARHFADIDTDDSKGGVGNVNRADEQGVCFVLGFDLKSEDRHAIDEEGVQQVVVVVVEGIVGGGRNHQVQTKIDAVLIEVEEVDESFNVVEGEVLAHSKDKDELYRKLLEIRPEEFSVEYTGEIPQDLAVVLIFCR